MLCCACSDHDDVGEVARAWLLLLDLIGGFYVAPGAQAIGATNWDDAGIQALRPQLLCQLLSQGNAPQLCVLFLCDLQQVQG